MKASSIIRNALTFGLNRLSPGEQEDADLFGRCLDALNSIMDEWNGSKAMLFREVATVSGAITGTFGTLGTTWPGLESGDQIISATVRYTSGVDQPIWPLTMEQYQAIPIKTIANIPQQYAHDGAATVYLYPAANGQAITLLTKQAMSAFADLDTDYTVPKGYQSALEDLLAEKMAPTLAPTMLTIAMGKATAAKRRLRAQGIDPAIIGSGGTYGRLAGFLAGR